MRFDSVFFARARWLPNQQKRQKKTKENSLDSSRARHKKNPIL